MTEPCLSPGAEAAIADIVRRALHMAIAPDSDHARALLLEIVRRNLNRDEHLRLGLEDQIVFGLRLESGAADVVIFHACGLITVMDVRVGDQGIEYIAQGLRAVEQAAQEVAVKCLTSWVRRCLLWSSTGDSAEDATLQFLCERSGVLPLAWPLLGVMVAVSDAMPESLPAAIEAEFGGTR